MKLCTGLPMTITLFACLCLMPTGQVKAQIFTNIYSFTATSGSNHTNSDGAIPQSLIFSGGTLYGTTEAGGSLGKGTVFKMNTDSSGFAVLTNFSSNSSDGVAPQPRGLMLSGSTLYGTTTGGDSLGYGTLFAVNTNGSGFTNLYNFDVNVSVDAGLVLSGNTFYGMTFNGGSNYDGTVFAVNTDGSGFTNLYNFSGIPDGSEPLGGLVLSGGTLYGTTSVGGIWGNGMVFAINTNGSGFTVLTNFVAASGTYQTNSSGAHPYAGLILSGSTLYGTTHGGGSSGYGTIFKINTDGSGFTVFKSFSAVSGSSSTNSDGAQPRELLLSGSTLYGTTDGGGISGWGTVFAVNTNGSGFAVLKNFPAVFSNNATNADGASPEDLILSGSTLYGTTGIGGSSGKGTVFGLNLSVPLNVVASGNNLVFLWPTNATSFTLQQNSDLSTTNWVLVTNTPGVTDNQNEVILSPTNGNGFYRLTTQ